MLFQLAAINPAAQSSPKNDPSTAPAPDPSSQPAVLPPDPAKQSGPPSTLALPPAPVEPELPVVTQQEFRHLKKELQAWNVVDNPEALSHLAPVIPRSVEEKSARTWHLDRSEAVIKSPELFKERMIGFIRWELDEDPTYAKLTDREIQKVAEKEYQRRDKEIARLGVGAGINNLHDFYKEVVTRRPELLLSSADKAEMAPAYKNGTTREDRDAYERLTLPADGRIPQQIERPEWLEEARETGDLSKLFKAEAPPPGAASAGTAPSPDPSKAAASPQSDVATVSTTLSLEKMKQIGTDLFDATYGSTTDEIKLMKTLQALSKEVDEVAKKGVQDIGTDENRLNTELGRLAQELGRPIEGLDQMPLANRQEALSDLIKERTRKSFDDHLKTNMKFETGVEELIRAEVQPNGGIFVGPNEGGWIPKHLQEAYGYKSEQTILDEALTTYKGWDPHQAAGAVMDALTGVLNDHELRVEYHLDKARELGKLPQLEAAFLEAHKQRFGTEKSLVQFISDQSWDDDYTTAVQAAVGKQAGKDADALSESVEWGTINSSLRDAIREMAGGLDEKGNPKDAARLVAAEQAYNKWHAHRYDSNFDFEAALRYELQGNVTYRDEAIGLLTKSREIVAKQSAEKTTKQ